MTRFDPQMIRLEDERERLDERLEELVNRLDNTDANTQSGHSLIQEARDVDQAGQAVAGLIDEYGPDATVTIKALNAGDYARVRDRAADMVAQKRGPGGVPGSAANVFAAMGLVDAPFLSDDADSLDDRISAVASQSPGVAKWLEDRIDSLGGHDAGNWKPLAERLLAKAGD